jgi:hypothetical protein
MNIANKDEQIPDYMNLSIEGGLMPRCTWNRASTGRPLSLMEVIR